MLAAGLLVLLTKGFTGLTETFKKKLALAWAFIDLLDVVLTSFLEKDLTNQKQEW